MFTLQVFGFFSPSSLQKSARFGTGESFLFKLLPDAKCFRWSSTSPASMFFSVDRERLCVGGGKSLIGVGLSYVFRTGFGLTIDSELRVGTSVRADTFCNEPLSSTPEFSIAELEVHGLVM